MKNRAALRKLILASILSALVIVMTVVPYTGYITIGGTIELTTLHIVTILAGVLLGWQYGTVVGAVWGLSCIARCLIAMPHFQPFGFANVFVALFPRMLVGLVSGALFACLKKTRLSRNLAIGITTVAGSLTNTVLVLTAMTVYCRMHGVEGYETSTVFTVLQSIVAALAGINGVIELVAAILLVPTVYFVLEPRELVMGIDFGGSNTKLALVKGSKCLNTIIKEKDESLDEAMDRLGLAGVKRIAITGVGANGISGNLRNLPTNRVEEFRAISRGVKMYLHRHNCIVLSVGTGSSFMRVNPLFAQHVGGSGLGGAMLKGMGRVLCHTEDMGEFYAFASQGDLSKVDILLKDVTDGDVSNLKPETTVANFGKLSKDTDSKDAALGIYNLVFQSLGVMAALTARFTFTRRVVVIGTVASFPGVPAILKQVEDLHKVRFEVAENSGFITAIGAAMY